MTPIKVGGWRREDQSSRAAKIVSQPDFSDLKAKMGSHTVPGSRPSDLRRFSPPRRHNQLTSNSCVANSMTRALENKRIQRAYYAALSTGAAEAAALASAQAQHVALSRLALYYLCREEMDPPETDKDEGTIVSIAAELLRTFGLSREERDPSNPSDTSFWPFDLTRLYVPPSWKAMRDAAVHKISSWARISSSGSQRVDDVIAALSAGNVVVYGTQVGDNWQQYDGSSVIMPVVGTPEGGHATMLCGWDPSGFFWDENSWDNDWGDDGFCKVSSDVVASDQSSDFVVIQSGYEPWHQQAA
jgi:Papain family cysteine protease